MDAGCSVLTLNVAQMHPYAMATADDDAYGIGGHAILCRRASVSIVNLPGSERLRTGAAQYALQMAEGPFKNRSITQFADLVRALARRGPRPQHVPCRSSKLVQLVGERLGGNARVHAIATLKAGQREESQATLKCASELRRVVQYPLVNSDCTRGLLAIRRAEMLALREDMQAMQLRGVPPPPQPIDPVYPEREPRSISPASVAASLPTEHTPPANAVNIAPIENDGSAAVPSVSDEAKMAEGESTAQTLEQSSDRPPSAPVLAHGLSGMPTPAPLALAPPDTEKAVDSRLAQSERLGQQLTVELLQARLKEHRVQAKRDKDALNEQIRQLEEQVVVLQREKLQEQSEKLRAAKALVELQVDGQSLVDAKEAEVAELEAQLDEARAQTEAVEDEMRRTKVELAAREAELKAEVLKREHAEDEMLAARFTLEQARKESEGFAADKGELEAEVVSSVNQARHREEQLKHLRESLDSARKETDDARGEAHKHAARADGLASDLAAMKRSIAEIASRAEALEVELNKANVQHELALVANEKQRVELVDAMRRKDLLEAEQERKWQEERQLMSKRLDEAGHGSENSKMLRKAQLELDELRMVASEAVARADSLERDAQEAGEEAAQARREYRLLIQQELGNRVSSRPSAPSSSKYAAEIAETEETIDKLRGMLVREVQTSEERLRAQLERMQARYARLRQNYTKMVARSLSSDSAKRNGPEAEAYSMARDGDTDLLRDTLEDEVVDLRRAAAAMEMANREMAAKLEDAAAVHGKTLQRMREIEADYTRKAASEAAAATEKRATENAATEAAMAALGQEMLSSKKLSDADASRDSEMMAAIRKLYVEKGELQKQLDRRKATEAEVNELTAELEKLKTERGDYKRDYNELMSERALKVQLREMAGNIATLETERSKLIRRATSAEEQLASLQEAMSNNILTYQKEIIRLRKALQDGGAGVGLQQSRRVV